ncbi:MAG: F-type H+-transporting ATPase subunit epsilon [Desulfovibrionales bacterium]|jgi:F-type H+-transporting ATPase subunit epsilon|nr:F-type H+-transporting ATPase subunit epsilon [Desulfovibrionales bacterium]
MSKELTLEVVTPERKVLSETVEYVGAPGAQGEFGIMANHVAFLSALGIGSLYYKINGKNYYMFVSGGFAEVNNNKVTILAEVAEKAVEIDRERALKAKERAEERLRQTKENLDFTRAQAALRRAIARMSAREHGQQSGTI